MSRGRLKVMSVRLDTFTTNVRAEPLRGRGFANAAFAKASTTASPSTTAEYARKIALCVGGFPDRPYSAFPSFAVRKVTAFLRGSRSQILY